MHTKTKRKVVNSKENSIDFYLSKTRDMKTSKRFFKKALKSFYVSNFLLLTVDKTSPTAKGVLYKTTYTFSKHYIYDTLIFRVISI
ncbi:DDE-type integrase/transposase/recombinase [Bacillus megaterium]|nr:DDE-type integrase/transposase/recombinase [Priestia megaterium]MBZ5478806.1 DDE-type integrase/transposase/recombinase [Bacillus sp. T_4]